MPFEQAAAEVAFFWGVELDETTVRRYTQAAGAAYVAEQSAEVERLERERPPAPDGPTVQYLSADGAMVRLLGGEWAEVKTLAIGAVEVRHGADGLPEAHTTDLTYFSRLADAETFTRQAYAETYRRGTESAGVVCAVQDGAEWLQGLVDVLRQDAVCTLDFPHAVEHLTTAAQPSRRPLSQCGQTPFERPTFWCRPCRRGWSPADVVLELAAHQVLSVGLQPG